MGKHTTRNISLVVALVAVAGAGIFVFVQFGTPQLLPNEIFAFISADDLPLLSITGYVREDMTCFIKTTLEGEFTDGTRRELNRSAFIGGSSGIAPTALDISVGRLDPKILKNLTVLGKVRCDYLSDNQSTLGDYFGWTIFPRTFGVSYTTEDLDGSTIIPPTISRTSIKINLIDNIEATFVRITIPASQIDALYSEHNQPYKTEFKSYLLGDLIFAFDPIGSSILYRIEANFPDLYNNVFWTVEKIAEPVIQIQLRDETIEIVEITQTRTGLRLDSGANKLDTSEDLGRQIRVESRVKTWDVSQGNPVIDIQYRTTGTTTSPVIRGTMQLIDQINDEQDGIFRFLYFFQKNSPEGEYLVTMTQSGRTQASVRSLYVTNSPDASEPVEKIDTSTGETKDVTTDTTAQQLKKQLEMELLQGQLVNSFKVNFADGTFQQTVSDSSGVLFVSRTGTLVPTISLLGTLKEGQLNTIISVEYELFLRVPTGSDFDIRFTDSNVRFTPKIIVSTVQEALGSTIPQTGSTATTQKVGDFIGSTAKGLPINVGIGHKLGKVIITANTIEAIAISSGVGTGQRVPLDLLIDASGDITFQRGTTVQKLEVTNTFVRLNKIIFDNQFIPDLNCQKLGQLDDPITGGCKLPNENDPTCMTALRSNIKCDLNFITQNCPENDLTMCNEPDKDNDGVPDIQDDCDSIFGLASNKGCPQGTIGGQACPSGTTCIEETDDPPMFGGIVCSSTDPDMCEEGQLDITTLLIIGGIGLIIVGVVVFVIRRRM